MFNQEKSTVAVIGLGLIGGSIAKSIKKNTKHHVIGFDIDDHTMLKALAEGAIDEMHTKAESVLAEADLVFLCLYPFETIEFVKNHYTFFKEDAIVTDTAGLKDDIVKYFNKLTHNDKNIDFIGGHPIAGSEKSGFHNSSELIFENASYILTPHRSNQDKNIEHLTTLIKAIGFDKIEQMSSEKHDEMIAYTSHLPHIIASVLLNNKTEVQSTALVGGSFKDATRVGVMNKSLWTELLLSNQSNVLKTLQDFEREIKEIQMAIVSKNEDRLSGLISGKAI